MKVDICYINSKSKENEQPAYPTIFKGKAEVVHFRQCEVAFLHEHDDGTISIVLENPATFELDKEQRVWLRPRYDYSEIKAVSNDT
jgi:hypothetical protein